MPKIEVNREKFYGLIGKSYTDDELEAVLPCAKAELDGVDKFVIRFHPVALRECIDVIQSDTVEMMFFETLAPFVVLDDEDPEFVYMQVPIVRTGITGSEDEDPRIAAKRDKKEEPEVEVVEENDDDEDEEFDW